ncbi:cytochrome c biogenesis protein CcsA [Zunongwangia sp.]|uniref:cytochrome c biogenesis protein CcsA n=1 Tax=Zunongwangia sp. TaxID=1965325 RepID=UPI003AA7D52D
MQKKIASILFSTRLMAVLFIGFAIAMAAGTFIENEYSIETARILIYNRWWFEGIMIVFLINFLGNIKRYQLYKREKWSSLILHLAFIFILIGAFITRYISYEGSMPIIEGQTTNKFLSQKTFFTFFIDGEIDGQPRRRILQEPVLFGPGIENNYSLNTDYNEQPIHFELTDFIFGAEEKLVKDESGDNYLKIVEAGGGQRHEHYLKEGEVSNIHNVLFALNKPTEGAINIGVNKAGEYTIKSPFGASYMRMADRMQGQLVADTTQNLMLRSLYTMGEMQFVIPDPLVKGNYKVVETKQKQKNQPNAVSLKISSEGETKNITFLGGQGTVNEPQKVSVGGLDVYLNYGSIERELPFSLKLNDFIADKYPGTENSYSSFKSKIEIIEDGKENQPYEIYMNHVLDHKGYRFFQSSFMPNEQGTILSVNHDFWGTWITYAGYFLLYFGLMWILFDKGSRFGKLKVMLDKVKAKQKTIASLIVILGISFGSFAQENPDHIHVETTQQQLDSVIKANAVKKEHAAKFGQLVIQDAGGRMKPANTFSSELLRKLSKKDEYKGLNSDQVFLSMLESPFVWYEAPLIYVKKYNDSIRHIAGVPEDKEYLSLLDFMDEDGNYRLSPYLEEAYRAPVPNQFQKDFIEADKRVNLLWQTLDGNILRIFPVPGDKNNKWVSYKEAKDANLKGMDSVYTQQIIPLYMNALKLARKTGDYEQAEKYLGSIKNYQKKFGKEVMPSQKKINAEILYNKYDIFRNLFWMYMLVGLVMLVLVIVQILKKNKILKLLTTICAVATIVLFVLHTAGLGFRWYISGHAPWSDAYESMIYVAWATMFFGLAFGRKSNLTMASTTFVASMVLMIAHWNWMDPAIANLQPVLNSYWLMIHVSVIVGSYGPFTLGMILGVVSLILMIITTEKNKKKIELSIREITLVNEMALTVGLVMLTIGNFLGGQWANESWGRYWGWDPKETWALISIMVYAFVIHMRLVPGLRGRWTFNFVSVIAYSSIMMTYFGVNFYLSGLHSYASGDKVITPSFIYYALGAVAVLGAVSYWRYSIYYKKKSKKEIKESNEEIV